MYSDKDLVRVLRKNLSSEVEVIQYYIDHLHDLNYAKNKKKIVTLIFDSFCHAQLISKMLLALNKDAKGKLSKNAQAEALREETGVKEIYAYESNRTSSAAAKKLLNYLVQEETRHEKLVKGFK